MISFVWNNFICVRDQTKIKNFDLKILFRGYVIICIWISEAHEYASNNVSTMVLKFDRILWHIKSHGKAKVLESVKHS